MNTPSSDLLYICAFYSVVSVRLHLSWLCASHIYFPEKRSIYIGMRAIFCQGGGCSEQFVQKFSPVAQIFTKQSKRNQGHTMH